METINNADALYKPLLHALNKWRQPHQLLKSPLISSTLVKERMNSNSKLSSTQALQVVLEELISLLEIESPYLAELLQLRFLKGLKTDYILVHCNSLGYKKRTIQDKQQEAVNRLAGIFWGKEIALRQRIEAQHLDQKNAPIYSPIQDTVEEPEMNDRHGIDEPPVYEKEVIRKSPYQMIPIQEYTIGDYPDNWEQYGLTDIWPTIEKAGIDHGNGLAINLMRLAKGEQFQRAKVIDFPQVKSCQNVLDLVYKERFLSGAYSITARIHFCKSYFRSSAGMILGWKNPQTLIRISLSAKLRTFLFEEFRDGDLLACQEFHRPWISVWDNRSVLLHVQYRAGAQELTIYWSKIDGDFILLGAIKNVVDLQGYMGLCVYPAGSSFPHVQFDTIVLAADA